MSTVRAFLFDFGGVLYRNPDMHWMRRWQALLGLANDPVANAFLNSPEESPYMIDVMLGKISEDEIWAMAAERYHVAPVLLNRLRKGVISRKRINLEVVHFLEGLRPCYKTAILSNASNKARQMFTEPLRLDRVVDTMIISAEEGLAKPDERIYHVALNRLGALPEEAVFLDDRLENIEAAWRVGMQAVQFHDTAQALAAMNAFIQV
jgi:epoxide hydrolase-like predicted phosphatase